MLFNSIDFLIFFPIVVAIFYLMPKKARYIWLLIASYYFYMSWNPKYAMLILLSTIVTYAGSLIINKNKKLILLLVLAINLGILLFFKYSNFLMECFASVCAVFNVTIPVRNFDILLPVGISFYTFQALSYTIDVYKGKIEPEKNFFRYALFVSFFPQLVAGPIERSENLLPQINSVEKTRFSIERLYVGLVTMLWGLFLKIVVADRVAILVNNVFDNYYRYGSLELIIGAIFFTLQIYCDFAGYSIMAKGAAKALGINLMDNFDAPFLARNIKEFWRRWHISLSTWFKDYLYIPLGGNRVSKVRKYINLMVVFLVSGLWHGAAMHYIVWGGLHGAYQIIEELSAPLTKWINKAMNNDTECFSYKLFQTVKTFILVVVAFVFFRADSIKDGVYYLQRMVTKPDFWGLSNGAIYSLALNRVEMNILLFSIILIILADLYRYSSKNDITLFVLKQNSAFQIIVVCFLLMMVIIFGVYGPKFNPSTFVYFQF